MALQPINLTESETKTIAAETFQQETPWQDNAQFEVTNYKFVKFKLNDGTTSQPKLALITTIGELYLSTLLRIKYDKDMTPRRSDGNLVNIVKSAASKPNQTNSQVLDAIVKQCKGKTFICKTNHFIGYNGDKLMPRHTYTFNEIKKES